MLNIRSDFKNLGFEIKSIWVLFWYRLSSNILSKFNQTNKKY